MNAFNAAIVNAYTAVCHGYQFQGRRVLQAFAEALTVIGYLRADPGDQADSASAVFSAFLGSHGPAFPLQAEKRNRSIYHLRRIIKVDRSYNPEAEKEKAYVQICDRWYCANAVQGAGTVALVYEALPVTLP
ncbi:MAG TPA: hypothetical protein VGN63_01425 [Flavisolibacter sp.]|jgi:hypothetical protein|nr:hypothetical protein [Flavisolibacter sp.]